MSWLALAFALQHADPQERPQGALWGAWASTGRLVDTPALHVGLRPAVELDPEGGLNWGAGATLQVTVSWLP